MGDESVVCLTSGQQVKDDKSVCLLWFTSRVPVHVNGGGLLSGIVWVAGILESLPCFMALVWGWGFPLVRKDCNPSYLGGYSRGL